MLLQVNLLLEWTFEVTQEVVRILRIGQREDRVTVIRIDKSDALPENRLLSDIQADLLANKCRILTADPFADLLQPDESLREKHRVRRDRAWSLIEEIVNAPNDEAFIRETRGQLVRDAIAKHGGSRKHVYRYLRRYWQAGMTRNGLLPLFAKCGGRGKTRKFGPAKRGRPRTLTKLKGAAPGINIGPAEADQLVKGYRMFYEKTPENGGLTKREAYERTLGKFFHNGYNLRGGVMVPVLPPAHELPSYNQFVYWTSKISDARNTLIRRQGDRKFNLRSRPVLGDSTLMAFGPGSIFQIDTTVGDAWIVSELNRSRRLGRPNIVLVVCAFSHLIAGVHVGLDSPSFLTAGLALENAAFDKISFCKQFGIEITADEWPSFGLPEAILADRGELEGYSASNLVQSLGIRVANTSPYRADMKGTVERTFRSMNDLLIHKLPGAVRKPKERGERDPRLDAALTFREFQSLLIHAILQHNSRRIESYRLQADMIADGLEPRPVDLWNWGIRNRSGYLRSVDPSILRANLLPREKGTVTPRGIKFRGLFYSSERAMREGWYERARTNRSWRVDLAFDPRSVQKTFLRTEDNRSNEECLLVEADQRFLGCSWADVEDFFVSQKEAQEATRTNDFASRTELHEYRGDIVRGAIQKAAAANESLPKSARLSHVKENRAVERRMIAGPVANFASDPGPAVLDETAPQKHLSANGNAEAEYVPPASPLDMLRRQREKAWAQNERL